MLNENRRATFPVIVSAPSGTGKTSICRFCAKKLKGLKYSVSVTTRPRRKGEVNRRDYHFVTEGEFKLWIEQKKFIEWTSFHGFYYGTLKEKFESMLENGYDVVADLDINGGKNMMKRYPEGVFIYLLPPSMGELKKRLLKRGTDPLSVISQRLSKVFEEVRYAKGYTYIVVNKTFQTTVESIILIIEAERLKTSRFETYLNHLKEEEWRE